MADKANSPIYPFYYGGVASALASCCTHPLDLLKVRLQTPSAAATGKGLGLWRTFQTVVKNESVLGLFNGLSAALLRQLTYSTVRFGVYEELKRRISQRGDTSFYMATALMCSTVAGALAGVAGTPSDIVNIRMQNDGKLPLIDRRQYKHALDGLFRIYREEGPMKLMTGLQANVLRAILMTSSQLVSYDVAKGMLISNLNWRSEDMSTHFSASLLAGLIATTASSPLDVIKTRLMSAPAGQYRGTFGALVHIVKSEGILALFKGWVPSYSRLGPQTILTFVILEQLKKYYRAWS